MLHYVGFTQSGHKCHNNLHIYLCINCHSKRTVRPTLKSLFQFTHHENLVKMVSYRRRGKIRWVKYSQFQCYQSFTEIFCIVLAISTNYLAQLKRGAYIYGKTFAVFLKTMKMQNF